MFKRIAMLCVVSLLLTGVVSSTPDQGQNQDATISPANWLGSELRVMTRNIYVGADLDMLLAQGLDVIDEVLGQLFMTSFPDRARGFAEEILEAKPHVIGLQEVSTISGNIPNFGAFEMDYLTILLMTLEAYGLHYTVASQVENFNITVPIGDPAGGILCSAHRQGRYPLPGRSPDLQSGSGTLLPGSARRCIGRRYHSSRLGSSHGQSGPQNLPGCKHPLGIHS